MLAQGFQQIFPRKRSSQNKLNKLKQRQQVPITARGKKKMNWTMRSSKQCCDTVSLQINHTIWNNIPQRMRKCACRFTKERLFKSTFTRGAMQKRNYLSKCHLCCQKLKKAASNSTIVITASYILQISPNIYILEWIEKKLWPNGPIVPALDSISLAGCLSLNWKFI